MSYARGSCRERGDVGNRNWEGGGGASRVRGRGLASARCGEPGSGPSTAQRTASTEGAGATEAGASAESDASGALSHSGARRADLRRRELQGDTPTPQPPGLRGVCPSLREPPASRHCSSAPLFRTVTRGGGSVGPGVGSGHRPCGQRAQAAVAAASSRVCRGLGAPLEAVPRKASPVTW